MITNSTTQHHTTRVFALGAQNGHIPHLAVVVVVTVVMVMVVAVAVVVVILLVPLSANVDNSGATWHLIVVVANLRRAGGPGVPRRRRRWRWRRQRQWLQGIAAGVVKLAAPGVGEFIGSRW